MNSVNNSYQRIIRKQRIFFVIILMIVVMVYTGSAVKAYWEQPTGTVFMSEEMAIPTLTENVHEQSREYEEPYLEAISYVEDENLYVGEYKTVQYPVPGYVRVTVLDLYRDGELESSRKLDSEVVRKASPKVVHYGTKVKPEYIYPVTSYVFTSGFGPRWGTNHNGVDLAVPTGTKVMATADGQVVQAGWNGGYGISVYIDHGNGVVSRYGHMSEAKVSVGQKVSQGEVIGLSGSTGDSTGPHVHFELRINGNPVDPTGYVTVE